MHQQATAFAGCLAAVILPFVGTERGGGNIPCAEGSQLESVDIWRFNKGATLCGTAAPNLTAEGAGLCITAVCLQVASMFLACSLPWAFKYV